MTKYATLGLSWLFSLFFSLLLVSLILTGNWLQAIPVLGLVLLLLPPAWSLEQRLAGISLSWWPRVVAIVLLLAAFIWFGSLNETNSIYKSPQVETRLMEIYDARLADWPVPYESLFVETDYGTVHVIASGPDEAPPLPPFTAEQRQSLDAPVLLVLGAEDNLVGDPEATRTLVGDIPDIRVEVLPTGHLIGVEEPERVNALILEFFETGE